MYSIVLMAAMSSTAEAPSFGGGWAYRCPLDTCLPMRYGWVCCGPQISYWHGCHGCGACYGCYGSCYGCHGYLWPLAYGVYPPLLPYGGYGTYPVPPESASESPPGKIGPGIGSPIPRPSEEPKRDLPSGTSRERTASIAVDVPADADVYIDGNRMKSTSSHRVFTTPPLEPGQDYYYWVRVVVEDGGKKSEEVKRVFVRAGERAEPSFARLMNDRPAFANATKRSDR